MSTKDHDALSKQQVDAIGLPDEEPTFLDSPLQDRLVNALIALGGELWIERERRLTLESLLLVGVQPQQIEDFGGSLTPLVKSRIAPAHEAALAWLKERGVHAQKRDEPLSDASLLAGAEMDMDQYEAERPTADEACRIGDDRVLGTLNCTIRYQPAPVGDKPMSVDVDHRGKY